MAISIYCSRCEKDVPLTECQKVGDVSEAKQGGKRDIEVWRHHGRSRCMRLVWKWSNHEEMDTPEGPQLAPREQITPSIEKVMEMMDTRWEAALRNRARMKAEAAIGLRFRVFQRDGFRCRYCGATAESGAVLHADHVIPQSKGGETSMENLVTACFNCNVGKSDRPLALVLECPICGPSPRDEFAKVMSGVPDSSRTSPIDVLRHKCRRIIWAWGEEEIAKVETAAL